MNNKKTVCLGVTGGIAAYKAPMIARELIKQGYEVVSLLTENATNFVTKYTMETVTKNPCSILSFDKNRIYDVEHIDIAKRCDIMLICPATANIIGKVACGIADDLLSTTIMAFKGKVIFAPSMNTNMYLNPIVQSNIEKLKSFGYGIIEPDTGYLACDDVGVGRLPDILSICDVVSYWACEKKDLLNKNVVVTAGPTREMVDPVRFISNRSSGKMGFAIAKAAKMRGANVTLIAGPNSLRKPYGIDVIDVVTTQDMFKACDSHFDLCDILIKAAAPCDFCIKEKYDYKIKKSKYNDELNLIFGNNIDILFEMGKKKTHQKTVGFAAETNNIKDYAKDKLMKKNLDMIVANDITKKGAGFNSDTNVVTFFTKTNEIDFTGEKIEVAHKLLDILIGE